MQRYSLSRVKCCECNKWVDTAIAFLLSEKALVKKMRYFTCPLCKKPTSTEWGTGTQSDNLPPEHTLLQDSPTLKS